MHKQLTQWQHRVDDALYLRGYRNQKPDKPVLHFLHGNGMNGLIYSPLLEGLKDDVELFLSDIEAHGDSDTSPRFPGFSTITQHCLDVCQRFQAEWRGRSVIGVGHSLGGILSLLMAASPQSPFDRLVLLDPTILPPRLLRTHQLLNLLGLSRHGSLAKNARRRVNGWQHRQQAHEYFKGRGMLRTWHPDAVNAYVEHALTDDKNGQLVLKCPPSREAKIFSTFPYALWRAIAQIDIPVTIIYGERSFFFLHESLTRAAQLNKHIRLRRVEGGHFFMLEQPRQAQEYLREALSS